jgi:hypothetical protein
VTDWFRTLTLSYLLSDDRRTDGHRRDTDAQQDYSRWCTTRFDHFITPQTADEAIRSIIATSKVPGGIHFNRSNKIEKSKVWRPKT